MSSKKSVSVKETNSNFIKPSKTYSKKQLHSPPLNVDKKVSRKKSTKSSIKNGISPLFTNKFSKKDSLKINNPVGKARGKTEFSESNYVTNHTPIDNSVKSINDSLNNEYSRTRKNLGQKMSTDLFIENSLASTVAKSNGIKFNQSSSSSTNQSSIFSPYSNGMPIYRISSSSNQKSKTGFSNKTSFMNIVKKYSVDQNSSLSDNTDCKTSKPNSSLLMSFNKMRSCTSKIDSLNTVPCLSTSLNSIEITDVPSISETQLKSCSSVNGSTHNYKEKPENQLNFEDKAANDQLRKLKQPSKRKSLELVGNLSKKKKKENCIKTPSVNDTRECFSLLDSNESDSTEIAAQISEKEISSFLDEEISKDLETVNALNANSLVQVSASEPGLKNLNVMNPTSYMITPSIPNSFGGALMTTPNMNNNIVYDANSLSYFPSTITNTPAPTILIVPVPCTNCSSVPNIHSSNGAYRNSSSVPPVVQLSCNTTNIDSILKSVTDAFYPSHNITSQNAVNFHAREISSNNIPNNSLVSSGVNSSSNITLVQSHKTHNIVKASCSKNRTISRTDSDTDSEEGIEEMTTIKRSSVLIDHFCELAKYQSKLSSREYKQKAEHASNFFVLSSASLSVKCFFDKAEKWFEDFLVSDPFSQPLAFKFDENLQESHLKEVLKKYVKFHLDEILKDLPEEPFNAKTKMIFKAGNSKLNCFEKCVLKKIMTRNEEVDFDKLRGYLAFVGMVVVFCVLKKQKFF